jgi:hypothetical protein
LSLCARQKIETGACKAKEQTKIRAVFLVTSYPVLSGKAARTADKRCCRTVRQTPNNGCPCRQGSGYEPPHWQSLREVWLQRTPGRRWSEQLPRKARSCGTLRYLLVELVAGLALTA